MCNIPPSPHQAMSATSLMSSVTRCSARHHYWTVMANCGCQLDQVWNRLTCKLLGSPVRGLLCLKWEDTATYGQHLLAAAQTKGPGRNCVCLFAAFMLANKSIYPFRCCSIASLLLESISSGFQCRLKINSSQGIP